ncbi:33312_t:CDS:1, partial [Racocetra persica]
KKLQILEAGEKFEIIIAGDGLTVNQGPGFFYLEATLDNLREIRKLGTEASSPAFNAETSQKVRANKETNPTLANQSFSKEKATADN